MTGVSGERVLRAVGSQAAVSRLGLSPERLLATSVEIPAQLQEVHLEAWSYAPDFTPIVQHLLQLLHRQSHLSVALCGPEGSAPARIYLALQLAIGLVQHGRETVVVDADPTQPGLGGLIADPTTEGLIDMVRFGRSCRALLRRPVENGPSLLALGSFPVDQELPFDLDDAQGVLHRVALHSAVGLYVTPFRSETEILPLVLACDQVVYTDSGNDRQAARVSETDTEMLQRLTERLAALVLYAPPATHGEATPAEATPAEATPAEATPAEAALAEAAPAAPAKVAGWDRVLSESVLEEGAEEARTPEPPPESREMEPELEPAAATPKPGRWPPATPGPAESDSATARGAERSPEEVREVRELLGMGDTDFGYEERRSSRARISLVVTLLVIIGGFLGWVVYTQRSMDLKVQKQFSELNGEQPRPGGGSAAPDDETAAKHAQSPPNETAGGANSGATTAPPASGAQQGAGQRQSSGEPQGGGQGGSNPPSGGAQAGGQPETGGATQAPPTEPPPAPTHSGTRPTETPAQTAPGGAPPASGAADETVYSVHVASYRKIEQANQDIANLRKHGLDGRAVRTDLGSKGIWFRVYVGSYPSRAAAEEAREAILKLPEYTFAQVRRAPRP
jgi:DedD protein